MDGRLEGSFELDFVLSFKYWAGFSVLAEAVTLASGDEAGPLVLGVPEAFAKNPKMLCCFPVDTVPDFLVDSGALAGVRAAAVDLSPILLPNEINHKN